MSRAKTSQAQVAASTHRTIPPAPPVSGAELASLIRLNLDQVEIYEGNPRTAGNPLYVQIRESIRNVGLQQRMAVTRRPGREKYTLARGGGTRCRALRELWEKTHDPKYYELDFELVPYVDDLHLLSAHLSENLDRSDMVFWDKAKSLVRVMREIEVQYGASTYEEVSSNMKRLGVPSVSKSLLIYFDFAVTHLSELGDLVYRLTTAAIKEIQPEHGLRKRLYLLHPTDEFDDLCQAACRAFSVESANAPASMADEEDEEKKKAPAINWLRLFELIEERIAEEWGIATQAVRHMVEILRDARGITWEELHGLVAPSSTPVQEASTAEEEGTGQDFNAGTSSFDRPPPTRTAPTAFAPIRPAGADDDGDRPPPEAIALHEAKQRAARMEKAAANAAAAAANDEGRNSEQRMPPIPPISRAAIREGVLGRRRDALLRVAYNLASQSRSVADMIMEDERLPMGWLVDVPEPVIAGTALAPQPKQVWWLLAQASLQIPVGMRSPDLVSGTYYGEFLANAPLDSVGAAQYWSAVRPTEDTGFLLSWLMDPAYSALGNLAQQLLGNTRDILANHPEQFVDIGLQMEFEDLHEEHQTARRAALQDALVYYAQNGADRAMVRDLFPVGMDMNSVSFRPGRIAEIDPGIAIAVGEKWEGLMSVPSELQRFVALHQAFPDQSMASLYHFIDGGR